MEAYTASLIISYQRLGLIICYLLAGLAVNVIYRLLLEADLNFILLQVVVVCRSENS